MLRQTIQFSFSLLSIFMLSTNAVAIAKTNMSICNGTNELPCTVIDTENNTPIVKRWRDVPMIIATYPGNKQGLENLWLSASAAPSAAAFQTIVETIQKITNGKVKKIINIDLREETHAYLNNDSITLTTIHNWINVGKSSAQVINAEKSWVHSISASSYLENVLTDYQFEEACYTCGQQIKIDSLTTEDEVAKRAGLEYLRLAVTDHRAPNDDDIDTFILLISNLPKDTWIHLHCRGGKGRATTFMAMYDMLKNANVVSFDEIIKRLASVPPYYSLYNIDHGDPILNEYYKKRLEFLVVFYQFAQEKLNGYPGTWSEWKNQHRK